jgi:hypothetical protein
VHALLDAIYQMAHAIAEDKITAELPLPDILDKANPFQNG